MKVRMYYFYDKVVFDNPGIQSNKEFGLLNLNYFLKNV